ncbi:hypothetical protein [uncultured Bilophila sp.]|uniref:hypothetical protein n=1 Tax=uncultured Bilophila sp. TaxID=529385 RepID=UPI00261859D5|nr:hypothetical protein [uncultured Bilophila sp.]
MGSSKKKKQVVGYDYFMAAIFGLCLKTDKLLKIVYGDRVAWEGQAADQEITVDRADLFGGNSTGGSGGLKGSFIVSMGTPAQLPNRIMRKYLGEDVYAHRGLVTLSMDKSYVASFSPQFRTLRCLVRHTSYDWYPAKAVIAGTQINPAHEIRDALINPDLGGQYTADDLDDASFRQAADVLYAENFGLSPIWSGTDKTETYIQGLLDCIDGIRTRDRATGRIRLRLLRGGYDAASLPVIGPRDFSALTDMAAVSLDALVNKVTLKYTKLTDTGEEAASITQENLANIDMQGGRINAVEVTFEHLTNAIPDLAPRILSRELRARSYPLRSFTLQGKSALESLEEGDLFVLAYPEMGLERMICRVLEADYGTPDKPAVTLTCAEDIFGADMQLIASPAPESAWQTPFAPPSSPTVTKLLELPYHLAPSLLDLGPDEVNGLPPAAGYLMTLAARPASTDYGYMHKRRTQNGWEDAGAGTFSASILLPGGVRPVDEVWEVGSTAALPLRLDDLAFIDEEIIQITAWTTTALHVRRGVLDTLPQAHKTGARLWLPSNEGGGGCTTQFAARSSASCVLATYGPGGVVDPARAPSVSLGMNSRLIRPYPPAGLRINGAYLPDEITGPLTVSWRHRDRIEQQDVVVAQTAADIGPEPGTTYTLRVYDGAGVRKKAASGLTGNTWTWETEEADCGGLLEQLSVELLSVRDGYESWQGWRWAFRRRVPLNLLLPSLFSATATGGGVSVTIHEDGTVTLDGTVTVAAALNVKLTNGLVVSEPRPSAWDVDTLPGVVPGRAATLTVTRESGTLTTSGADGFNVTLRHSAAEIFLNAKIGDGLWTATGTPAEEVKMLVFYIRAGTVMDNLKLTLRLAQEES